MKRGLAFALALCMSVNAILSGTMTYAGAEEESAISGNSSVSGLIGNFGEKGFDFNRLLQNKSAYSVNKEITDTVISSTAQVNAEITRTDMLEMLMMSEMIEAVSYMFEGSSLQKLNSARDAALEVYIDSSATSTEIEQAYFNLSMAFTGIRQAADKLVLKITLKSVESQYLKENYSAEDWAVFETALKNANAVLANTNSTQAQFQQAYNDICDAAMTLESTINKYTLSNAIAEADSFSEELYTAESWAAFQSALSASKVVFANNSATATAVADAYINLMNAQSSLKQKVSKIQLGDLIDSSKDNYPEAIYAKESYAAFSKALSAAEAVYANTAASESAIIKAYYDLEDASGNLFMDLDKETLSYIIQNSDEFLETEGLSDAQLGVIQAALSDAQKVNDNAAATAKDVAGAVLDLVSATTKAESTIPLDELSDMVSVMELQFKEDDYTAESWVYFQEALASAEAVVASGTSDNDAIMRSYVEFIMSIDCLEELVTLQELSNCISEISSIYAEKDYTAESWAVLQDAIKSAQAVVDAGVEDNDITSKAMDGIRNAENSLVEIITIQELSTLISETQSSCVEADYTAESWAVLQKAIAAAQAVVDAGVEDNDITSDAYVNLTDAKYSLVEIITIQELSDLISEVQSSYVEEDYTAESWAEFENAIKAGQEVVNAGVEDNKLTITAYNSINIAQYSLVEIITIDELKAYIEEIKTMYVEDDYTAESWAALQKAITNAQAVVDAGVEDNTQTTKARNRIDYAIFSLEEKITLQELSAAIADIQSNYSEANYTAESWAKLQDAIKAAQAVVNAGVENNAISSFAYYTLMDSMYMLESVMTLDKLSAYVAEIQSKYSEADYTAESWAGLEQALKLAQETIDKGSEDMGAISEVFAYFKDSEEALVKIVSKEELTAFVAGIKDEYKEEDYSAEEWLEINTAITQAESVIADVNADSTTISNTYNNLFGITRAYSKYALGDINGDGSISPSDALSVLKYCSETVELTQEQIIAADVDKNGSVTSFDALRILQYSSEIISEF